ncbi:MAG: exo-alpha-sialidase [Clostridia bacterium]|nr:exo-alpha-sialidase [Clostridia bacterium]MBQ4297437.1 exo-alpha-sialidase [Clostridia bacterium]
MIFLEDLPASWSPEAAGERAMERMIPVTAPEVKGAHDAQFITAEGKAYIVYEADNFKAGESALNENEYAALSVVDLASFSLECCGPFARRGQTFAGRTLCKGNAFLPRVLRLERDTLRFFFTNVIPEEESAYHYYLDYDLPTGRFSDRLSLLRLRTPEGEGPLDAANYRALFRAAGHACEDRWFGVYLLDLFEEAGTRYLALNNFVAGQNSLARFNRSCDCVEIVGHIGGVTPTEKTTESGIARLPDGRWMAILRNEIGDKNYRFSYSRDGRLWSDPVSEPFLCGGVNSKPVLFTAGGYCFMGWNEGSRTVYHLAFSADGRSWRTLFTFRSPATFQYPTFRFHAGELLFSVTTGQKERICFGKAGVRCEGGRILLEPL